MHTVIRIYTILLGFCFSIVHAQDFVISDYHQVTGDQWERCMIKSLEHFPGKIYWGQGDQSSAIVSEQSEFAVEGTPEGFVLGRFDHNGWHWKFDFMLSHYGHIGELKLDQHSNIHITAGFREHIMIADRWGQPVYEFRAGIRGMLVAGFSPWGELLYAFTLDNDKTNFIGGLTNDGDGNVIIGGMFWGQLDFDPTDGEYILDAHNCGDGFVAKYSPHGQLIWAIHFPGNINNAVMDMDSDGRNIYLCGYFGREMQCSDKSVPMEFESRGKGDGFVVALDSDGALLWNYQFGGKGQDRLSSIRAMGDRIFVSGSAGGNVARNFKDSMYVRGHVDGAVLGFKTDGSLEWMTRLGGDGNDLFAKLDPDYWTGLWLVGSHEGEVSFGDKQVAINSGSATLKNHLIKLDWRSGELLSFYEFAGVRSDNILDFEVGESCSGLLNGPGSSIRNLISEFTKIQIHWCH